MKRNGRTLLAILAIGLLVVALLAYHGNSPDAVRETVRRALKFSLSVIFSVCLVGFGSSSRIWKGMGLSIAATMSKSKPSDHYVKVVAWSDEDQCYVGRCPGLMLGGVHGSDERAVYAELCEAVDEWIRLHEAEGRPLPRPTSLREIEALV